jgi:hypothetical protein
MVLEIACLEMEVIVKDEGSGFEGKATGWLYGEATW